MEPSAQASSDAGAEPPRELRGAGAYLKEGFAALKPRIGTFLGLMFAHLAIFLITGLILMKFTMGIFMSSVYLAPVGMLVYMGVMLAVSSWTTCSFFLAVTRPDMGVKQALKDAVDKTAKFITVFAALYLVVTGGFYLLILPGLLFMVWFFAAPYAYLFDGDVGLDALFKSMALVRGKEKTVAISIIAPVLLFVIAVIIPVIGWLAALVLGPLIPIVHFQLYKDLKSVYSGDAPLVDKKIRGAVLAAALLGLAVPVGSFTMQTIRAAKMRADLKAGKIPAAAGQQMAKMMQIQQLPEMKAATASGDPARIQETMQKAMRDELPSQKKGSAKKPAAKPGSPGKLDIEKAQAAQTPAAGTINGKPFALSSASYDTAKGILTLRQGPEDSPDLELQLHLPAASGSVPEGKGFKKTLKDEDGKPHAFTFWKLPKKGMGKGTYQKGFQLKLDFKAKAAGKLPGALVFGVDGKEKSEINGTFEASVLLPKVKPLSPAAKKPKLPEIDPVKLDKYCGNEIGILCNDKRSTAWSSVRCLRSNRNSLLKKCRGYLRYIGRLD